MASPFTRIIHREIPSYILAEDDNFIAFLDIHPLTQGHTLVVPKKEVDYIFDHDDRTLSKLLVFAKKIASAIQTCIPCKRIGIAVIGFEVPHAHVHLVPMNTMSDINFTHPKLNLSEEDFQATAHNIKKAFSA